MTRQRRKCGIGMTLKHNVEVVGRRGRYAMQQVSTQHVEVADLASSKPDMLVRGLGFQSGVEMTRQNAPKTEVVAKDFIGQIAVAAPRLPGAADRLFKVKIFQPVQRVVMHEGAHGPVVGDDLAGETDERSELHPLAVAIVSPGYLDHSIFSMVIR